MRPLCCTVVIPMVAYSALENVMQNGLDELLVTYTQLEPACSGVPK